MSKKVKSTLTPDERCPKCKAELAFCVCDSVATKRRETLRSTSAPTLNRVEHSPSASTTTRVVVAASASPKTGELYESAITSRANSTKMMLVDGHAVLVPESVYIDSRMQALAEEVEGEPVYAGFASAISAPESTYADQFEIYGVGVSAEVYMDYRSTQLELTDSLVGGDSAAYNSVWSKTIITEFSAIVELKQLCATVVVPAEEPRQPDMGDASPFSGEYWSRLKAAFSVGNRIERTASVLERIAGVAGAWLSQGPLKKDARAIEKVKLSYDMDFGLVKDYLRFSIVCPAMAQVIQTFKALVGPEGCDLDVLRIKNRFDPTYDAGVHSANYRDLQAVCRIPGGSGLCVEVQIHLAAMHKIKASVSETLDNSGKTGHQRYTEHRERKERTKFKFVQQLRGSTLGRCTDIDVGAAHDEDVSDVEV